MFFFTVFHVEEFDMMYDVINTLPDDVVLISYDRQNKVYELTIDIKELGYGKYVRREDFDIYRSDAQLDAIYRYFTRISIEEYIEEYTKIYVSDKKEFPKMFIYAKNKIMCVPFVLFAHHKTVLRMASTIQDNDCYGSPRQWNQQFKQYFKGKYIKFVEEYCLDRGHFEVTFERNVFQGQDELEVFGLLHNQTYDEQEEEEIYTDEEDDWDDWDDAEEEGPDDFYDEYDEAEVDLY